MRGPSEKILGRYDPQEGDHQSVCVEETPGTGEVQRFNTLALEGDPQLTSSIEGMNACYGSLSHSHLNQLLKNILGKVIMDIPEITDKEGRLSLSLLAEVDENFAAACETDLQWETLSFKLREEDRACEII